MICAEFVCTNIVFLLCGYDAPQMNQTMMSTIASHIPAGTSTYTILHYAQEKHEHDGFHAYDWGKDQTNYQHHGTYDVPQYNLGDVTTPVALYWSDNDYFAMPGVTLNIADIL